MAKCAVAAAAAAVVAQTLVAVVLSPIADQHCHKTAYIKVS